MKNQKIIPSLGGRAIAAGGFGCVFLPPLKCKGIERPTGKIVSKLLTTENAIDEFNEAKEIQSILKTNLSLEIYNRYFIFPEKQCEPDALTKDDLVNFDKKCKNLTKKGIMAKTINKKLKSVRIIELVNGGSDLDDIIDGMKTMTELGKFNKNIIELLKNAIVPMNRLGILHYDLKSGNILADKNYEMRVIDWGLSVISKNNRVPDGSSRPIQYNLPFSTVLFNKNIIDQIDKALKKMSLDKNYKETIKPELSTIIHNIVVEKFAYTERGHIGSVSRGISKVFNIKGEKNFFIYNLLSNYLTEAVINFINPHTKTFDATKYFNEVAAKNCDIWGIITIYDDIYTHFRYKLDESPDLERLRLLVIRYLYSTEFAGKPIDIDNLVNELIDIIPFSGEIKTSNASIKKNHTKTPRKTEDNSVINLISSEPNNASIKKNSVGDLDSFDSKIFSVQNKKIDVGDLLTTETDPNSHTKTKKKRCKNGTRRNKKTGKCEDINRVRDQKKIATTSKLTPMPPSLLEHLETYPNEVKIADAVKKKKVVIGEKKTRKRCKNGTRRNKKTGECDKKKGAQDEVASLPDVVEPPSLFERLGF
jgi:hypothetical protein